MHISAGAPPAGPKRRVVAPPSPSTYQILLVLLNIIFSFQSLPFPPFPLFLCQALTQLGETPASGDGGLEQYSLVVLLAPPALEAAASAQWGRACTAAGVVCCDGRLLALLGSPCAPCLCDPSNLVDDDSARSGCSF